MEIAGEQRLRIMGWDRSGREPAMEEVLLKMRRAAETIKTQNRAGRAFEARGVNAAATSLRVSRAAQHLKVAEGG